MNKTNKTVAPVQTDAASKINEPKCITAPSRRPTKVRLTAGMNSKFWKPIAMAQLEQEHAADAGAGEANAVAQAEANDGRVQ